MDDHIPPNDPRYRDAAAEILRRHEGAEPEANITSTVRDFLTLTGLAQSHQIVEENPPSDSSRRAVDLTALDTFMEFKRRLGTSSTGEPDPRNVEQIDDYLTQSAQQGRVRMGILTDGKHWLLRWPGAATPRLTLPYFFSLESPDQWLLLYEWLRDQALVARDEIPPSASAIEEHFGTNSPTYQRDIASLRTLYTASAHRETIRVKRHLWHDLLHTALGEIVQGTEQMDDLFIRHTYLSAVIGMVVQASFGIDIRRLAETNPDDLLQGRELHRATGLQGVLESDFFAWPNEAGGGPLMKTIARRVARFKWSEATPDTAANLYEIVIPPEERRQLGEYYTPAWLARTMVRELVTNPLEQRVLDPACGSGTFVAEVVTHFIEAAKEANWEPKEVLNRLRDAMTGIDVHPVAVHLARAAWTMAARPAINAAVAAGFDGPLSIPVYLGDSLQLRFRTGDMFAEREIRIQTHDDKNTELVFPVSLVERAESFDALMGDISKHIEEEENPLLALDDNGIQDPKERQVISKTIAAMQNLHAQGRNHIWAYYTRNMVRPVVLSRAKVDVVIGNPPWINYNQTSDILRSGLRDLSQNQYDIWAGRQYATHQDVGGLFFTRSMDLYLKPRGTIGFVLPHSALQAGQYSKWRTGQWCHRVSGQSVHADFTLKPPWDLEQLEPNNFFPVPSSVVFASKCPADTKGKPLAGEVERWMGKTGSDDMVREIASITDTSAAGDSPYGELSRNGATIFPRVFFFINETPNPAIIQAAQTVTVNPRRGSQDHEPWKNLDLTPIMGQTIESQHLFNVHLGETIAPYVTLKPLKALLPLKQGDITILTDDNGPGGIQLAGLERRMRERWQTVSRLWDDNKARANKLNLLGQMDYLHKLSSQLEWQKDSHDNEVRVVYSKSGEPTAAILHDKTHLVENVLFWVPCKGIEEANYLQAIINSNALQKAVKPLMTKGQFGARDLHKQLWKLPIPKFNPKRKLHTDIAEAGSAAARGAGKALGELREQHADKLTWRITRRELRRWLRTSDEGRTVETAVGRLLAGG